GSILPRNKFEATILPSTAIHFAQSVDEHRYLAGLAMYYGAGAETTTNRTAGQALVAVSAGASAAVGILAAPLFPFVYGILSPLSLGIQNALAGSADLVQASVFATQIVMDMGGDPYAGLRLMERMDQLGHGATRVMLEAEDRQLVMQFI